MKYYTHISIGSNYYGLGNTTKEAETNRRKQGGKPKDKRQVGIWSVPVFDIMVNPVTGGVTWRNEDIRNKADFEWSNDD